MAEELRGASVAAALTEALSIRAAALAERGILPTLAILRLGERADDLAYERAALKRAEKIGIAVRQMVLSSDASQCDVTEAIRAISSDPDIHACLPLRPFPEGLNEAAALAALSPDKDVDCATDAMLLATLTGRPDALAPCTAEAVIAILDYYGIEITGARVAVVGRSNVIGRPIAALLTARDATVTVCHSRTVDVSAITREAEVLVVAAGQAHMIGANHVSSGQTVIDVGINWDEKSQRLVGDVDTEAIKDIVAAYTPVPGGVGSVTTAILAKHVIEAAERAAEEATRATERAAEEAARATRVAHGTAERTEASWRKR